MGEQPIFSCKAHVFHIDPKTKRSWIPASSSAISVSFFYDSTRSLYRIISVEGTKAVINSTITPSMSFTKTSQKFGQWSDVRANTVYGLGFPSEAELNKFIEKFQEVKEATKAVGPSGGETPVAAKTSSTVNGSTTPIPAAAGSLNSNTVSANASPVSSRSVTSNSSSLPPIVNVDIKQETITDDLVDGGSTGVSPALLKSALASHQRSQSLSGLQPSADSPKHASVKPEKNMSASSIGSSATLPAGSHLQTVSAESQLKYENDRLKLALAQSSANAKKWEVELATLKNNNARLTNALQESTANVEEWKRQLQAYKDENLRLKNRVLELESGKGASDSEGKRELVTLRQKLDALEMDAKNKDEEIRRLTASSRELTSMEDKIKRFEEENQRLENTLRLVRSQLETVTAEQDTKRRVLEALNAQLFEKIQDLKNIHNELHSAVDT